MPNPTTSVGFSNSTPAAPTGDQVVLVQSDYGQPLQLFSFTPRRATGSLYGTVTGTEIVGVRFVIGDVGKYLLLEMSYAGAIAAADMFADVSGNAQITVSKSNASSYPTFTSIVASAPATLVSQQKNTSVPLTGWTLTFAKGDLLKFNFDSGSTIAWVYLNLQTVRS